MQTTLPYQHQLNTIRVLTISDFFAQDHLSYNTSVSEENYSTLRGRGEIHQTDLNSTSTDQYSPLSKCFIFKPNTSLTGLFLASVYHFA